MWMLSFLKKSKSYESILEEIESKISKARIDREKTILRKQWISTTWVLYSGVVWGVFTAGFWWYAIKNESQLTTRSYGLCVFTACAGPLIIYYTNKIVARIYDNSIKKQGKLNTTRMLPGMLRLYFGDILDLKISELVEQRKKKVDELKKDTKFEEMKRLIDKYDADSQSGSTQTKIKPAPSVSSQVHNLGKKEGTGRVPRGVDVSAANIPRNVVSSGQPDQQQNNVRQIPTLQARHEGEVGVVPLNRHQSTPATVPWLEKFVDRIVGDDETAKTRYALICKKCYCHNGLVLEEEIRTIQYYCPKCSYFNASLISLEQKKVEITAELMNLDEKNTDINTVRPAKDDLGTDEKQNPETPEMKTPTKAETENSKPSKSPKNRNSAKKAKSHQKKSSS